MANIKSVKRGILLLLSLWLIAAAAAGCGGGSKTPPFDRKAAEAAINQVIARYENGIEAYNVSESDGVLSCFEPDYFLLTISDYKKAFHKQYKSLKQELEGDIQRQNRLRQDHGYEIDLELGPASFSDVTRTKAYVSQPYSIYESSSVHPRQLTSSGVIDWEFVYTSAGWKAVRLVIYDTGLDP